jgi:hypothetical protein
MVSTGAEDAEEAAGMRDSGQRPGERLPSSKHQHQGEEDHGHDNQCAIEQEFLAAGGALTGVTGGVVAAGFDADLFLVFEVPHHFAGCGVAVAWFAL